MKPQSVIKKTAPKVKKSLVLSVFSRHPSHSVLRRKPIPVPVRSCIRFGSTTVGLADYTVQINSPDSVRNSASKKLMKECFLKGRVKTAQWFMKEGDKYRDKMNNTLILINELPFPIVVKSFFGSRGKGNTLINNNEQLVAFEKEHKMGDYLLERYYSYSREYRLHMTSDGCFYTCRKMLKQDAPQEKRWFRNDSNCVWIMENNELFDTPSCWNEIVEHCKIGLREVGLDVGAFDVRVQSKLDKEGKERKTVDFIIIEVNSAASFGEITEQKYREIIPKIIENKLKL